MNTESARAAKSKRSRRDLSIWEIEETIDYESLSDELLNRLYSAKEEQRRQLLKKISHSRYRGRKHASKKSRRLSRSNGMETNDYTDEDIDTETLDFKGA